jgi:hypothetical protein
MSGEGKKDSHTKNYYSIQEDAVKTLFYSE